MPQQSSSNIDLDRLARQIADRLSAQILDDATSFRPPGGITAGELRELQIKVFELIAARFSHAARKARAT